MERGVQTIVSVIIGIGVQLVVGVAPEPLEALFMNGLAAHTFGACRRAGRTITLASRIDSLFMVYMVVNMLNAMPSSQGWICT